MNSFCKVNGVVRSTERTKRLLPVALVSGAVLAAAAVVFFVVKKDPEKVVETKVIEKTVVETREAAAAHLTAEDKAEIDDQLRRAAQFVEMAQYTDPPERSAKACLDRIRMIDAAGQYRGAEVKALSKRIVDYYIDLATRSHAARDMNGTVKWLDRAKLMNANMEVIRDKEREFGIIKIER